MGRHVAETVARRLGRTILELGGNNGIIVMDDANLDLALRAVLFGAVGTAGQRCTTTRRLFLQRGIAARHDATPWSRPTPGPHRRPAGPGTLMGPLVNGRAVDDMMARPRHHPRSRAARSSTAASSRSGGCFVEPTLVAAAPGHAHRARGNLRAHPLPGRVRRPRRGHRAGTTTCRRGSRSAIFTTNLHDGRDVPQPRGSDCGIANVNIGTSGAEIGGAFGGEKDTGGGRESGSDSWKAYMRRQTITINWSAELPLAQGIRFQL